MGDETLKTLKKYVIGYIPEGDMSIRNRKEREA
jgi:hypothetical protein